MRALETTRTQIPERRRALRVNLYWTVHFFRPGDIHPIEGQTRNVSSKGLYCIVAQPFTVGEVVTYMLMVPTFGPGQGDPVHLAGQADVLRVERLNADQYGIACRVRDYRVVQSNSKP
jgi:hypothetical protein